MHNPATVSGIQPPNPSKAFVYPHKDQLLQFLDQQRRLQPVKSAADWQQRRDHILHNFQLVTGLRPASFTDPDKVEVQYLEEVDLGTHVRKKLLYTIDGNDKVPAYLLLPKKPGPLPAVLCLHQTTKIGKGEPAGLGGLANLHYAKELAERGYVTLAPDYPRFGDYTGCDPYQMGYASATAKGIANHRRAVTLLQQLPEVDGQRIGCIGHSLGGHNAIFLAALDERVRVLASSCGFCSFPKYYGGNLKGWTHAGYMPRIASVYQSDPAKVPFDFTELLGCLAPRPVFINAPLKDSNFAVEGVKDCVTAALPVYQLFGKASHLQAEYPDAGHDFPSAIREKCYQFFDAYLRDLPLNK